MLTIYANSFMTATRTGTIRVRDYHPAPRKSWRERLAGVFRPAREIELDRL